MESWWKDYMFTNKLKKVYNPAKLSELHFWNKWQGHLQNS